MLQPTYAPPVRSVVAVGHWCGIAAISIVAPGRVAGRPGRVRSGSLRFAAVGGWYWRARVGRRWAGCRGGG